MSSRPQKLNNAEWLNQPDLQNLLSVLESDGKVARINGGAVRNAVLGEPIADIDISTEFQPEEVVEQLKSAGIKVVPTGLEHGTVTAVVGGKGYEITTLREDVETDGRHAVVKFGQDWTRDAQRRDLTMNALYCDRNGVIFDPLGAYDDLANRRIRFIGDATQRIREDYLRILRFFRFFAWYGSLRPDAEGLKACTRLKTHLGTLSAERVWAELKKLLGAPDPRRALLWMRTTGVLTAVLPESEHWGIDLIHPYLEAQQTYGWSTDALERLETIIPKNPEKTTQLAGRLKLSNLETEQLQAWAMTELPAVDMQEDALQRLLYWGDTHALCQTLRLEAARLFAEPDRADALESRIKQIELACGWQQPEFPLRGKTLLEQGHSPGQRIGIILKSLERRWVDSGFTLNEAELLALVDEID